MLKGFVLDCNVEIKDIINIFHQFHKGELVRIQDGKIDIFTDISNINDIVGHSLKSNDIINITCITTISENKKAKFCTSTQFVIYPSKEVIMIHDFFT